MAITLRSTREIELLRRASIVVVDVLSKLQKIAKPGVTTAKLDSAALQMTVDAGAQALFKGVRSPYARIPFPGAICASVNEQVVHGIPSVDTKLEEGDILSIDFGVKLDGYCGDAAVTIAIGEISESKRRLMDVTRQVLDIAVATVAPGVKWSHVAAKMQDYAESAGFSVVKDFVGHGIGRKMHEEPRLPNFVSADLLANDIVLAEGMVLAVEPMINAGNSAVRTLKNGWTVVTKDNKCSAHFEHTIVIVDNGCEVLTGKL
ncbi:MAG: type I methionyl aminopeptidase [Phycisphaerae bacterium]|nr:type I methionyl aminopeptidase [Phycisphaerae bacterium]NIP53681.1 type I methionyl aminopeptidase [Phycisphaerae bacterium]NIS52604.1 type I methionyl aminopeptidase [Phycisphaerae bacterium]NIU10083.1 type I methionyl aminopeptidase [Phycisphaerae bacterium]NIV02677.1 type I methionyl aminopeptidase [Phycisphaerae bacterium]